MTDEPVVGRDILPFVRPEQESTDLSDAGLALAGWEITIVPAESGITDDEYDAACAALDEYDVEGQIDGVLSDIRKAPALRKFRVVFD